MFPSSQLTPASPPAAGRPLLRRLAGGVALGFLAALALLLISDMRQVGRQVWAFDWRMLPLALLLTLFNYAVRGVKWHLYIRQVGAKDYPFAAAMRLFVAGFPLAMTPGKVGEALKAVWLERETGVPVAQGVAIVAAERISDGIAVLILSTVGVFAYPQYWPAFAFILAALLAVAAAAQIRPLAEAVFRLTERLPVVNRFTPAFRQFYDGSFRIFKPRILLAAVALGCVSWLGEGLGFYLILVGLGQPPSLAMASMAVFILSFSTVVGAASALPGGIGAAEASIAGMLTLLLRLSAGAAGAAALLIRFATLWFGVGLGLLTWLRWPALIALSPARPSAAVHPAEDYAND